MSSLIIALAAIVVPMVFFCEEQEKLEEYDDGAIWILFGCVVVLVMSTVLLICCCRAGDPNQANQEAGVLIGGLTGAVFAVGSVLGGIGSTYAHLVATCSVGVLIVSVAAASAFGPLHWFVSQ